MADRSRLRRAVRSLGGRLWALNRRAGHDYDHVPAADELGVRRERHRAAGRIALLRSRGLRRGDQPR